MTINIKVEHLDGSAVRKYISDNCNQLRDGFWEVKKELKVWKSTTTTETLQVPSREASTYPYRRCIVALRIPVGEKIYVQPLMYYDSIDNRKMRASKAYVEKQFVIGPSNQFFKGNYDNTIDFKLDLYYESTETTSVRDITFVYQTGNFVSPAYPFYDKNVVCASGIHFFVNLTDALYYV